MTTPHTMTAESGLKLARKAFLTLDRLNVRYGTHLHWLMNPGDWTLMRTLYGADSSVVDNYVAAGSGESTLIGVRVETSEDIAPGSLSLVIEA